MNMLKKTIPFPMFAASVTVILTDDVAAVRNGLSHRIGAYDDLPGTSALYCQDNNDGFIILNGNRTCSDLVHESNHAVWFMMKYMGADLDHEVFAYIQTYIFEQGLSLYDKWKEKYGAAKS